MERKNEKEGPDPIRENWENLPHKHSRAGFQNNFLNSILAVIKPNLVSINEMNYKKSRKVRLNGYKCLNRNRQNAHMGGVATCVKDEDAVKTLKLMDGDNDDEILVTRHSQFVVPINVINVYGAQECHASKEEIERNWGVLMGELTKIEAKNERVIMIGDFNKHV